MLVQPDPDLPTRPADVRRPDAARFAARLAELLRGERIWRDMAEQKANFWQVLEYGSSYEIRYSRMLAWLLDPTGTHGLGSYFVDRFAALAKFSCEPERDCAHRVFAFDGDETTVRTEVVTGASKNKIDVFVEDAAARILLVVENKVGAQDSQDQLDKYFEWATSHPRYRDHCRGFVFLTVGDPHPAGGWRASEPRNSDLGHPPLWSRVSYRDLAPLLEGAILRAVWNQDRHTQKIIEDFYFDIQRIEAQSDSNYLTPIFTGASGVDRAARAEYADDGFLLEAALLARSFAIPLVPTDDETGSDDDASHEVSGSDAGAQRRRQRKPRPGGWEEALLRFATVIDSEERGGPFDPERFFRELRAEFERRFRARHLERGDYRKLAEVLWQARPHDKQADMSKNPISQRFMRMLFNALTGSTLDVVDVNAFGAEQRAPITEAAMLAALRGRATELRLTGKQSNQAVQFYVGGTGERHELTIWLAMGNSTTPPSACGWELRRDGEQLNGTVRWQQQGDLGQALDDAGVDQAAFEAARDRTVRLLTDALSDDSGFQEAVGRLGA